MTKDKLKNTWKQFTTGFKDENILLKVANKLGDNMNKSAKGSMSGYQLNIGSKGIKIKKSR